MDQSGEEPFSLQLACGATLHCLCNLPAPRSWHSVSQTIVILREPEPHIWVLWLLHVAGSSVRDGYHICSDSD